MTQALKTRAMRQIRLAGVALGALLCTGTVGYRWIEQMPFFDAFYLTVITVTTVGFGEVHPLSVPGRVFTIVMIFLGVMVGTFSLTTIASFVFSGDWRAYWRDRRQSKMIGRLNDQVILCGYGRVGRHVAEELRSEGLPFVVIDPLPERIADLEEKGFLGILGDAAQEANLRAAGIERAHGLIAAANGDAENVFIVLTAHTMRPDLTIAARADSEESEPKLRRAGATRVILPYHLTGRRLVSMIMRPAVSEFLDEVEHTSGLELLVEQVPVPSGSPVEGLALQEARARHRLDVTVLAVKRPDGSFDTKVNGDTRLTVGSLLIAVGTQSQLAACISALRG